MRLRKGKIFTSIIGYTSVILLFILWTGNLSVRQYSFYAGHTISNATFQILMTNLTTNYMTYGDLLCDVKYAIIVFERGIDSSTSHLLSHREQNRVSIFSSGREELLLYGIEQSKHRKDSSTLWDLLGNITHGNPGCWRNLKFVVFCRNTTLVNVKNVLDMLEFRGKPCYFHLSLTLCDQKNQRMSLISGRSSISQKGS